MELSSQDGDMPMPMPMPINSTYGHGHMIHHDPPPPPPPQNHIVPNSVSQIPSNGPMEDHVPYKKMVKYRECLKNHAAAMGGNATDGCGEFMPSGEEGTLEALTCSACNCHRNFHRKQIEGETEQHNHSHNHSNSSCDCYHHMNRGIGRKLILGHHFGTPQYPTTGGTLVPSRPAPQPHQMIMSSYNMMGSLPSESDDQEDGNQNGVGIIGGMMARPPHLLKKRFRTKFSQEQKEKMLNFAEKVGWKIQKQEESVVQQFCQEVGVKRRVLKVWMHNNKHSLAKKNPISITPNVQDQIN